MTRPERSAAALEVRGLVKRFKRPGLAGLAGAEPPAVNGVDLEVRLGEVVALIGESGSGKTTLVRAALGLLPFEAGSVKILGRDLSSMGRRELREWRHNFQLLFQDPVAMLNPGLSVRAHLLESARLHRPEDDPEAVAADCAAQVGLTHRLDALPRRLSGGEKRRVGLARLLAADPALLVADEPTSGLDAALKADLVDLVLSRRGPERAFLLVSHDLPLMTYASDRVVVMYAGDIIEAFPTAALGRAQHHPYTAGLLHAAGLVSDSPAPLDGPPDGRGAAGCPYRGACPLALAVCASERPTLSPTPSVTSADHRVACHALEPA